MGFEKGKHNVYTQMKLRVKELEEALAYERSTKPMLQEFANNLGHSMLVMLATTPFEKWPTFAVNVFRLQERTAPTAAHLYKQSLPKE